MLDLKFHAHHRSTIATRIGARIGAQHGFTLVELLVVVMVIGLLASLAIPSFLNQRNKGDDASLKTEARNSQTAMETYFIDYGVYTNATVAKLQALDPTLGELTGVTNSGGGATSPSATAYRVTASASGRSFWIDKTGNTTTRGCSITSGSAGGCKNAVVGGASGTW